MTARLTVAILHPDGREACGFIPSFLDLDDPRPAREQLDSSYRHGGGFRPFVGFEMDPRTGTIGYPGDPSHRPMAAIPFRDETILIYQYGWVAILQPDGSHQIARMD